MLSSETVLQSLSLPLPLIEEGNIAESIPLYLFHKDDKAKARLLCGDDWAYLTLEKENPGKDAVLLLPGKGGVKGAIAFYENPKNPESFGVLARKLPRAVWSLQSDDEEILESALLGIGLDGYVFTLSDKKTLPERPLFVIPSSLPPERVKWIKTIINAVWMGRNLVNLPANILGPQELAQCAAIELKKRGASVKIIKDRALEEEYPSLSAVAAGSDRGGAVLSAHWSCGKKGVPHIALVGKGVCFDTGGYDLKPSNAMLKMKKDMGGAALMLGLACALIETNQELEIDLRLGCVENSVSGHAMRPGDVINTRKGYKVEIGNTDAEGRLVLCDLLTEVSEKKPDVIVDAATLTGAARVALGPDVPALFCNDDPLAEKILKAGLDQFDPLWRLPLWAAYNAWLDSDIADFNNVSSKPMAGAITAALYLQNFVPEGQKWAHIDSYAWNDHASSCHPKGGEIRAFRALLELFSGNFKS